MKRIKRRKENKMADVALEEGIRKKGGQNPNPSAPRPDPPEPQTPPKNKG